MAIFQLNNLAGKLTRLVTGAMNGGMARIGKTKDINPFGTTSALLFNEIPTNLDPTHATIKDVIIGMAPNVEGGILYNYAIDRSGNLYKINTTNDAITTLSTSLSITLKYGGGIKIVTSTPSGPTQYIIIAHDAGALYTPLTGASSTNITLLASGNYQTWISNIARPISDEFAGYLYIGNGNALVQWSIASIAVTSNAIIADTSGNSAIPNMYTINALSTDGELRYLRITITTNAAQDIATVDPTYFSSAPLSRVLYWNGIDQTYDSADPFNQSNVQASLSFLGIDVTFGNDFFGPAMFSNASGTMEKVESFQNIRTPNQGALTASAGIMMFAAPYYTNCLVSGNITPQWTAGIFTYGVLDNEDANPYLACQIGIQASGGNSIVTAVGAMSVVQNRVLKSDGTVLTNSKIYVSTYETGGTAAGNLYSFNLTPSTGTPASGPIETPIEPFTMMQKITDVSIYQLPASSGVSWQLDLIDVDSSVPSGATLAYTYASGADPTLNQGAVENFHWNPQIKNMQALGVRFTNKGTVQPGIVQIFITTQDTDSTVTQS